MEWAHSRTCITRTRSTLVYETGDIEVKKSYVAGLLKNAVTTLNPITLQMLNDQCSMHHTQRSMLHAQRTCLSNMTDCFAEYDMSLDKGKYFVRKVSIHQICM